MEHIQRATIQLQVVVNEKRKLEQTATSYTAPRHAFRSCLSCGHHTGLFLPLPVPPPPPSTGAANANRVSFWSQPRKMRRRPPYCVFARISTMPIIHSPSVLVTQKIAIWILPCTGSAGSELVTRQTVCFKIYRSLGKSQLGGGDA